MSSYFHSDSVDITQMRYLQTIDGQPCATVDRSGLQFSFSYYIHDKQLDRISIMSDHLVKQHIIKIVKFSIPTFVVLGVSLFFGLAQSEPDTRSEIVRNFVDAFNAQDSARMATMVTDDILWLSVSGSNLSIEVQGKTDFVAAMQEYFASCPTCRSKLADVMPSHERVSVIEVASWRTSSGTNSQQSLAVYEFDGQRIKAVYYFPEESRTTHIDD